MQELQDEIGTGFEPRTRSMSPMWLGYGKHDSSRIQEGGTELKVYSPALLV